MKTTNQQDVAIPADLRTVLAANPAAHLLWNGLTPLARNDFILWLDSAKQPETRKRRVESIPSRLASGKRRPCCFAVVPMELYKALGNHPAAKAHWKELKPMERRSFVSWIDLAKDAEMKKRVEKACLMIAEGRHSPKD